MSVKYFDKSTNQWKIFPGTTGLPGKDGKDCFDVARENGYTGTKEDYYKLLKDIVDANDKIDTNANNIETNANELKKLSRAYMASNSKVNEKLNVLFTEEWPEANRLPIYTSLANKLNLKVRDDRFLQQVDLSGEFLYTTKESPDYEYDNGKVAEGSSKVSNIVFSGFEVNEEEDYAHDKTYNNGKLILKPKIVFDDILYRPKVNGVVMHSNTDILTLNPTIKEENKTESSNVVSGVTIDKESNSLKVTYGQVSGGTTDLSNYVTKTEITDINNNATTAKTEAATANSKASEAVNKVSTLETTVNGLSDTVDQNTTDIDTWAEYSQQLHNAIINTKVNETKPTGANVVTNIQFDENKNINVTYGKIESSGSGETIDTTSFLKVPETKPKGNGIVKKIVIDSENRFNWIDGGVNSLYLSTLSGIDGNQISLVGNRTQLFLEENTTLADLTLSVKEIEITEGYDGVIVSNRKLKWKSTDNFKIYLSGDTNNLESQNAQKTNMYIYAFHIVEQVGVFINGSIYVISA